MKFEVRQVPICSKITICYHMLAAIASQQRILEIVDHTLKTMRDSEKH